MAERLATLPEESTNGSTAASAPPRSLYREWIQMVAVSGEQIRSTLFSNSQSSHNGSSYSSDSGASNSYPSNNSGSSSGSASVAAPDLGAHELTMIARQMVSDGYTKRMVQAFNVASPPEPTLEIWFSELDVDWVLQIREGRGSVVVLQDRSASSLHGLAEKWIRALTVIVVSITELVFAQHETLEVARFGKASIDKILAFIDAIVPAEKVENLRVVLDMYVCVSNASYMFTPLEMSPEGHSIFTEIGSSLAREGNRLNSAIISTMKEVRTLVEDDNLWASEFPRGGGEIHRNTRFMVDCIVSMRKALATSENSAPSSNSQHLRVLINGTIYDLKGLLLRKSMLCSDVRSKPQTQKLWKVPDPGLRYLLRKNIAKRVISVYRHCLEKNPELEKHVIDGITSSPDVLEQMLGELFEG